MYNQKSLDEYFTLDGHIGEETVDEVEEEHIEQSSGESPQTASESHGCEYCCLRGRGRYTLHAGSIFLYVKDGELKALADIDHVFHKCREGLRENIVFLYRMMCEFKSKGYDVLVVGKAFDDDLYAYFVGRVEEEKIVYNGLNVKVIGGFNNIEGFEKMNWYMQSVDGEMIAEAIGEVEKNAGMPRVEDSENSSEPDGCYYCSLKGKGIFLLHPGFMYLYVRDGEVRVLADKSVYCRSGLMENIGFLYRMFNELCSRGYSVAVVCKAFPDEFHVKVWGSMTEDWIEYNGFPLKVFDNFDSIEEFEERVEKIYGLERVDGETVIKAIEEFEVESVEVTVKAHGCGYCSLKDDGRFVLHQGAVCLYVKDGWFRALADIDYVYRRCRSGLRENIKFLMKMLYEFRGRGYDAVAVCKDFDDDLYIYVRGEVGEDTVKYNGLDVRVVDSGIGEFEEMNYYMDRVDGIVVCEAFDHLLEYAKKKVER